MNALLSSAIVLSSTASSFRKRIELLKKKRETCHQVQDFNRLLLREEIMADMSEAIEDALNEITDNIVQSYRNHP